MIKEGKKKKIEQQLQWIDNILADAKRTKRRGEVLEKTKQKIMMSNILILLMFTAVVGIGLYWLLWGNWDD